jgi:Na+-driven multidrug efflux pump
MLGTIRSSNDNSSLKRVLSLYVPIVVSRICMKSEAPLTAYAVSRFLFPEQNLAALGGIILCLGQLFEAPVLNFVGAASALVGTKQDFYLLRSFQCRLTGVIGALYLALLLTPLSDWTFKYFLAASPYLVNLSRGPLLVAGIWPLSVGYRRVCQGALIRAGKARIVTLCSFLRVPLSDQRN